MDETALRDRYLTAFIFAIVGATVGEIFVEAWLKSHQTALLLRHRAITGDGAAFPL